ncbi:Hsp70 family protein [Nocardia panacis]|nr:Hsp70 family protein [Nocardia panacis]
MTERLALGITVGASNSVAVAAAGEGDGETGPARGGTVRVRPSALSLTSGTPALVAPTGAAVVADFLHRVGDPVDIRTDDGRAYRAADLVATTVTCLIDEMTRRTGYSASTAVVCHPAWWSRHTVEAQRTALAEAGLDEVTLVPEPAAALRWLAAAHGPLEDGATAVYDLGASGLTISVLRTGEQSGPLGAPLRSTDIAGSEFDLLTMRYVLANAMGGNDFDPFDPALERELSALRARCRNAKEELSINTATVVPVRLGGGAEQIRLVRDELEEMLRGPLSAGADLLREAVHRAGLGIGDIDRVLLTGGGGSIPLVAELISSEFGLEVVAAPQPAQTSARGAALLAADLATAARTDALPAALAIEPAVEPEATRFQPLSREPRLPETPQRRRRLTTRQRAAIVAGAAVAIGVLTTGTLAVGTGAQSGPNPIPVARNTTPAPDGARVAATSPTPNEPDRNPDPMTAGSPRPNVTQPVSTSDRTVVVPANNPQPSTAADPGARDPSTSEQSPPANPPPNPRPNPAPNPQPNPAPNPQPNPAPNPQPPYLPPAPPPPPTLPSPPTLPPVQNPVDPGSMFPSGLRVPPVIPGGNGG